MSVIMVENINKETILLNTDHVSYSAVQTTEEGKTNTVLHMINGGKLVLPGTALMVAQRISEIRSKLGQRW